MTEEKHHPVRGGRRGGRGEVDRTVDAAVAWLAERKESMEEELTLRAKEIGDYLIEHFFDNDINEVASQNPVKNMSFRRLCERTDLPFPETALRRFLHVAINFRLLPAGKAKLLPPSHHSVLYQVADPGERRKIGIEAANRELSVRKLREIVKGKGRRRPGAGRKPETNFYKNWKQLVDSVQCLAVDCTEDDFLEGKHRQEVRRQSRAIRDQLNRIIDRLNDMNLDDEGENDERS